ncbi:ABC transporter permease [Algicella marina]|uniref:ABC transporter permease subunit n=1 Tax=Algicella marina TaxID=2683284 RepID=A0A6P1SWV4_9RHOB|nr:ABC transporter permease [Algicella marina]QHQ35154.1 ABC transporter permease subunit [Algicella marina]
MSGLLRGYGRGLTATFFALVAAWALLLIAFPQITMLERALTAPKRQLDSSIALQLSRDASTCISVLETNAAAAAAPAPSGGLTVPSPSGVAVPSPSGIGVPSSSGMAVPSASGGSDRPYVLQCDRASTHTRLVRDDGIIAWLDETYDIPTLTVPQDASVEEQKEVASEISALSQDLYSTLRQREANAFPFTLANFNALTAPRLIPISPEQKAVEDAQFGTRLLSLSGLRYERDGEVYMRLGLVTLARTLVFAILATALALVICYPIAYKVALATPPKQAVWLFLGLIIPYAIVELMRIYAWTTIIDTQGLINGLLGSLGLISEPIPFKRFPATVFVVIVYTYVLFMVFPIYNVMSTLDRNQIEAARDLGATSLRVHRRIVIPHAKPGIAVGCIATFMLAAGAFSVPRIISRGLQAEWFSQTIYSKFFESENSNIGAAYSFAYTILCFVIVGLFMWIMRTRLKDFARSQ